MRIGIVGAGFMGVTHAAGWAETGAQLMGFVAETPAQAQTLAAQYRARVYTDLASMLPEVDVVDLCTPTHLHHPMALEAAAAGKHIVCEKPLARTLEQGQAMIAACRAAGVKLLVAHVVRFFPEYALAKSATAGGQIGKPAVIRLARGSFRPKKPVGNWFLDFEKSGGMMLDLMIHDFDYARWLAGEVESVYAKSIGHARRDITSVDYGMAILKHRNGALSHIAGAWAYPPPTFRTRLEIAGDGGLIEFDSAATAPIEMLLKKPEGEAPDVGLPSSPLSESPYTIQIKEFYNALAHNRPARVSAEDGLAALQIALAAIESAKTGRAVRLSEPGSPEVKV